jgi:hypothetical protein
MGRDAIAAKTMKVGKKGGGKHWTAAEVAERKSSKPKKVSKGA